MMSLQLNGVDDSGGPGPNKSCPTRGAGHWGTGFGGDSCGNARFRGRRDFVTLARGWRLAELFDQTLAIESLVN
ncbi:MAG: hypothetical protein QOK02_3219 [Mycobacterium sp.]|jgi:hypothetical protein|nr:hypothetical protein [Mycobacterium sp.]